MTFRVGQQVVCIDASCAPGRAWNDYAPKQGDVYTVSGFGVSPYGDYETIEIAEINHPWGYRASRFRPIVSRKTDISALKALLVPGAKIRETA
jgi:hypothetical protein